MSSARDVRRRSGSRIAIGRDRRARKRSAAPQCRPFRPHLPLPARRLEDDHAHCIESDRRPDGLPLTALSSDLERAGRAREGARRRVHECAAEEGLQRLVHRGRCPADRRDEPRFDGRDGRRPLPQRPLLPAGRLQRAPSPTPRAGGRCAPPCRRSAAATKSPMFAPRKPATPEIGASTLV